jgi:hypothetical protein
VGQTYDANGNQTTGPPSGVTYDAENRIASATGVQYAYDSRNKRIWTGTLSNGNLAQQVCFYGVDGQKLGMYTFTLGQYGETNLPEMTNSTALLATFFGSKRVGFMTDWARRSTTNRATPCSLSTRTGKIGGRCSRTMS